MNTRPSRIRLPLAVRGAARFIDRWHWLVLLLAAPLLLLPTPATSPALLVLPGLWAAAVVSGRPGLPRTPLNGVLLMLGVMFLVSVFVTFDMALSLSKIASLLLGYGLYFAGVRLLTGADEAWRAGLLLRLAGAALAVVGLVTVDWLDKVPALNAIISRLPEGVRGLPGAEEGISPNAVAGTLLLIVPMQLTLLSRRLSARAAPPAADPLARRPGLWLLLETGLLVMTGGVLLISQSRAAWAGLAAALLVLLAWHGPRARRWVLVGLALVGGGLLALAATGALPGLVEYFVGGDLGLKLAQRAQLWSYGLLAIRDFPLTGMGLNVFRVALPVLYSAYDIPRDFDFSHAHNQYLQAAVDLGLAGLVAYLALWLGLGWALWTAERRASDPWLRALIRGLGVGLAAYFVFGLGDAISLGSKLGVFFWSAAALSIGLYRIASGTELNKILSTYPGRSVDISAPE